MAKDRTKDLTRGTPWKVIAGFSLPVIGGNLFQLFYTLADSMIVGRTLRSGRRRRSYILCCASFRD